MSPASVSRILARNGYTRKIIEKAFFTGSEAEQVAWVAAQWKLPLSCRICIDEALQVGRAAKRRWAWSVRGTRSESCVESSARARTILFVAMAHDCVLHWIITRLPPGQTAVYFLLLVTSFVLPRMLACVAGEWRDQPESCVPVLDNARIHDSVALASLRAARVFVLLMPPYSPDFNQIQHVISARSSWLRRWSSPDELNAAHDHPKRHASPHHWRDVSRVCDGRHSALQPLHSLAQQSLADQQRTTIPSTTIPTRKQTMNSPKPHCHIRSGMRKRS